MRKIFLIPFFIYSAWFMEYALFNTFGGWFKPDLLLLLIVFFNLYSGIRYSLYAACVAGMLRDAFGVTPFGLHIFIYIICAYLTTFVRYHVYQPGSRLSRLWVVFLALTTTNLLRLLLGMMIWKLPMQSFFATVVWPEFCITLLVTTHVFAYLKGLAGRLRF